MGGTQSTETDGRTTVEHNRPKGSQSANNDKGTQSFKTDSGLDNCRPRTAANGDYSSDSSVESSDDYNKNKHDDKKIKFIECEEKFYCSDSGVFYDDGEVRIMFMMEKETPTSYGLSIAFKNKTNFDISSVNFEVYCPNEAIDMVQDSTRWGGETLRANGEKHIKFRIVCFDYFEKQSIFRVMFVRANLSWMIKMNLPIYIHKFLEPFQINKSKYQKWDKCLPNREEDVVRFATPKIMFSSWFKKQLEDFGFMVHSLENFGVDKPEIEYVGTGKIYTRDGVINCLLQLRHGWMDGGMDHETSLQEYSLMLRTSLHLKHFKSSKYILDILFEESWKNRKSCH